MSGEIYLEAFWSLSADRRVDMSGIGPIPFTAIDRYASRYGFDDDFPVFEKIIRDLDRTYLEIKARP